MRKLYTAFIALVILCILPGVAQVTTQPQLLQEDSENVVLTYSASSPLGNDGLRDLPSSDFVYAHIGVITTKSSSNSDWQHVVTPWPEKDGSNAQAANLDKNRLRYLTTNLYQLTIGNLRSYFDITDPAEHIKKIAIVFRNADGTRTGKTKEDGDIFIDVVNDGFDLALTADHDRLINAPTTVTFTLTATKAADLALSVNGTQFAAQANTTTLKASYKFEKTGTYTVTGSSSFNGKPYTTSYEIAYPSPSQQGDYPGGTPRMGCVRNDDGSVTFCLAAPGKTSVQLVGSWNAYEIDSKYLMKYHDYQGQRYFWTTVSDLADDVYYPYYFIVDDTYRVGDPYAHLVLDPYNDRYLAADVWPDRPQYPSQIEGVVLGVYRGDIDNYKFSDFTIPEHDNLIVYEMLFRDFTGTDGLAEGNGTVAKAIEKLPYIKALGFNAVELMPIMEFNGNNSWGYNTNFYMAPDKAYGSPRDYKDFIEACHREGMAVILDIVFNQSDGLHPWYQMYPVDSNPFYNKTAPHAYSVLNDWNQGHPLVQQQWTDALRYWMEKYNVDGFRFDLVKGLGDNDSYTSVSGTDLYNQSRVDRMARLHSVIKSVKPDGIHINENLAGDKEETAMGNDGQINWANINNASCQYAMSYDTENDLNRFLSTKDGNRPWGTTISYAESHDEQRVAYKVDAYAPDAVKNNKDNKYARLGALATQMLLTPGPKMVWQFGELGNNQNTKNSDGGNNTDPKIVDWTGWLGDADRAALMNTYSRLINLRRNNPELFTRQATFITTDLSGGYNAYRYMRLLNGSKEVIAFINPSLTSSMTVSCPASVISYSNHELYASSKGVADNLSGSGTVSVTLPANGFAVYVSKDISSTDEISAAPAARVYGENGRIVIDGDYKAASVYDISGRRIDGFDVPAGIYIVTVDDTTTKVVVK